MSGRSSGVEHNLAKVGVEGSNPFARSNYFNVLSGGALAAKGGILACGFISLLIGMLAEDGGNSALKSALIRRGRFTRLAVRSFLCLGRSQKRMSELIRTALGLFRAIPNSS